MQDEPKVLIPYDRREAIPLNVAAQIADRSESTLRSWCQNHHIGRRVADGPWRVSRPALQMFLDGDRAALKAYLEGERDEEIVAGYFRRCGLTK